MNDSFTVVVVDNATGTVYTTAEWECVVPEADELENTAQLYKRAAASIADIIARNGSANVTATILIHTA